MRIFRFVRTFHLSWSFLYRMLAALVVIALALPVLTACSFSKNENNNYVLPTSPQVAPVPASGATPVPTSGACYVPDLRVGPFGFDCDDGVAAPKNTDGVLPMGCRGVFTATPKFADGTDVPAAIHGSEITWTSSGNVTLLTYTTAEGIRLFRVASNGPEAFNKIVKPLSLGAYTVTATVCGKSATYRGEVTK